MIPNNESNCIVFELFLISIVHMINFVIVNWYIAENYGWKSKI